MTQAQPGWYPVKPKRALHDMRPAVWIVVIIAGLLLSMVLVVLVASIIALSWQAFLTAAIPAAAAYGLYRYTRSYDHRYQASHAHRQALAAHADYEHRLWLQGDSRGFYGQYQPHC